MFKLHFGRLTGKAYTKGERVLRFEAIAHNTAELRCGRMIEKFPAIVTQLAGIVERFATALDCVDTGFIGDDILDELPTGTQLGATRVGGVDLNKPRLHDALRAALALAPAPNGFTVAEFTAKVHALTGHHHTGYSVRQAGYDLRKLRGKRLVDKPGRTRHYHVRPLAARTIAALLTLRDQVIAPILAAAEQSQPDSLGDCNSQAAKYPASVEPNLAPGRGFRRRRDDQRLPSLGAARSGVVRELRSHKARRNQGESRLAGVLVVLGGQFTPGQTEFGPPLPAGDIDVHCEFPG